MLMRHRLPSSRPVSSLPDHRHHHVFLREEKAGTAKQHAIIAADAPLGGEKHLIAHGDALALRSSRQHLCRHPLKTLGLVGQEDLTDLESLLMVKPDVIAVRLEREFLRGLDSARESFSRSKVAMDPAIRIVFLDHSLKKFSSGRTHNLVPAQGFVAEVRRNWPLPSQPPWCQSRGFR